MRQCHSNRARILLDVLTVASTTTSTPRSAGLRTLVESSASGPPGKR